MRKWDSVTEGELLTLIEFLKTHYDPELAFKIIELFHERMQDGELIPEGALYALTKHAFQQIMDGRTADQAFGLSPIRGKYNRPDTLQRDMAACAKTLLRLRKGEKWLEATSEVAGELNMSDESVRAAYGRYIVALESQSDDVLTTQANFIHKATL